MKNAAVQSMIAHQYQLPISEVEVVFISSTPSSHSYNPDYEFEVSFTKDDILHKGKVIVNSVFQHYPTVG